MMITLKEKRSSRMPNRYWDWDPFKEFSRIHRLMNELMGDIFGYDYTPSYTYTTPSEMNKTTWTPPMNMYMKDNTLTMHFYLPGMTKENIELSVTPNTITISGNMPTPENVNDENWMMMEFPWGGKFYRHVELPYEIMPNEVKATYKDGLLTVTCPLMTPNKEQVKVNIN